MNIGSLCAGYGGLEEGVRDVLGGEIAWQSEIDPGACKILAHRYPGIPNIGDMTAVNWAEVEPIDVLVGGTPCQDLSHAGKRAGMTEGTRSNLWVAMRDAIAVLRPTLVVWENVRGACSAPADSELEPREGRLGVRSDGPVLRALGRVLGDLSELGFDAEWIGLRAADVGAPHGRFRVFLAAWPAQDADRTTWNQRRLAAPGQTEARRTRAHAGGRDRAPAANSSSTERRRAEPDDLASTTHRAAEPRERPGTDWGPFALAIRRWELLTRPAPPPTEPGRRGQPVLSASFVEWMQGLPAGWVTQVPGLDRNEQLKALGNGVVWQQAAAALRILLADAKDVAA